jgi:c-di-GMP-binding flagellar brake protein YcgR
MENAQKDDRRSIERITIRADRPVYLQVGQDQAALSLLLENISMGGATLICPEESDAFREGKPLAGALLLSDGGRISIQAVVRWRIWPKVGIQFDRLSDEANQQISQILQENRSRS